MTEPSFHETFAGGIDIIRWPHKHLLPESEIIGFFEGRDIQWTRWSRKAQEAFDVHSHEFKKTLFCVQGEITFKLPTLKQTFTLNHGDRLILPPGIPHGATAGSEGVTCIEAGKSDSDP